MRKEVISTSCRAVPFPHQPVLILGLAADESSSGFHAPRLLQRLWQGSSTKSLTCFAIAWPGILWNCQPSAADVLALPLPWPGEIKHDRSQFLCTDRMRRAETSQKKDDSGKKTKKRSNFFPICSPATGLLPRSLTCLPSRYNILSLRLCLT